MIQLSTAGGIRIGRPMYPCSDLAVLIRQMHDRGYDLWLRPIVASYPAIVHIPAHTQLRLDIVENYSAITPPWVDDLRLYLATTVPLPLGDPECPPST